MTLQLPELPYSKDALRPFITAETFDYHYGKHHATYVNNLAGLVKDTALSEMTVPQLIQTGFDRQDAAVFNNAAQHWNHTFFWHCLSPDGGGQPAGQLQTLINRDFGSFDQFKTQFSTAAVKLFGAGWAWLALNQQGALEILPLKDAHTPLTAGKTPLLTIDVWEHAYYIDYRNARNKFIDGFWEVVNWDFCHQQLNL
ncbi:superoxide dismutase [Chitinophaga sp. PC15]|uniref:Superoxide dismutase n=1 Tax=Chitinophaga nivalis TaxID=2991709 RepID=A0ABT3IP89_9BACT|nr:superoxide dismutase [Chitinophaga nivalis]MCW3485780.1 superoxide dismutase [Chitinophaga nivalis]